MTNKKYYGGENQIAHLPFKTIDALQQLGIEAEKIINQYTYSTPHYFLNSERFGDQFVNNLPGGLPIVITTSGSFILYPADVALISKLRKGNKNMFIWKSYSDTDFAICSNLAWKDSTHTNITFDAVKFTFNNNAKAMYIEYAKYDSSKDKYSDTIYKVPQKKYRHNTKITKNGDVIFIARETSDTEPFKSAFQLVSGWGTGTPSTTCSGYNLEKGKTIVAFNIVGTLQYTVTYSDGTNSDPVYAPQMTTADFTDIVSE